jgi:hypothetical protein
MYTFVSGVMTSDSSTRNIVSGSYCVKYLALVLICVADHSGREV